MLFSYRAKRSIIGTSLALIVCSTFLFSCVDTSVKTLGVKSTAGGKGTPSTDADSFSVMLAYRKDANPDDGRVVQIQGVRNASANFKTMCGTLGTSCTCRFYTTTTDTSPVAASSPGFSEQNNSFSCSISGSNDPDLYQFVQIRTTDGTKSSGLIRIKTTLSITDVLGDLDKASVRKIYRYSCNRTFFEGEGVTTTSIACLHATSNPAVAGGQKLGLISATYNFYLYQSTNDNNFADKGGDTPFDTAICGYNSALKISCSSSTPTVRYGLYASQAAPFTVAVSMSAKPDTNAATQYGFAALPDSAGNCPTGLTKIRPYVAQAQSIIKGSINGTNPPSNFININNSLNNTIVEEETQVTSSLTFDVTRQPNSTPCAAAGTTPGDCSGVTFGGITTPQQQTYTASTPVVCAIPPDLLSGI